MVRSEISSTFGRKTASGADLPESESRWSQGESWVWLKKKLSLEENTKPNVKPSHFWTCVSKHGLNTGFVSSQFADSIIIIIINNTAAASTTMIVFPIYVNFFTTLLEIQALQIMIYLGNTKKNINSNSTYPDKITSVWTFYRFKELVNKPFFQLITPWFSTLLRTEWSDHEEKGKVKKKENCFMWGGVKKDWFFTLIRRLGNLWILRKKKREKGGWQCGETKQQARWFAVFFF